MNGKIASFVLEMWFRWHQSLWIHQPVFIKVCIILSVTLCLYVCVWVCVFYVFYFLTEETCGFVVFWLTCRTSQRLVIMIFHYLICLYSLWIQQQSSRFCKLIYFLIAIWICKTVLSYFNWLVICLFIQRKE